MSDLSGQPDVTNSIGAVQTAAELRRQLHTIKAKDREAVLQANQTITGEGFLKSKWATALGTSVATFLLLYITNPSFVHEMSSNNIKTGALPSLRKITSWSILVFIIVALGPIIYLKLKASHN